MMLHSLAKPVRYMTEGTINNFLFRRISIRIQLLCSRGMGVSEIETTRFADDQTIVQWISKDASDLLSDKGY